MVSALCFFGSEGNLFAQTSKEANPFIGKWVGEWTNVRSSLSGKTDQKGELVVKENGKLEFVFGNDPRAEYSYTINEDVLSFTSGAGKVREFRLTKEGKLKGELKNPSHGMQGWVCWLERVP
jgi:hypothetical protein